MQNIANVWFQKSRLGLGTFKFWSRLEFLLKVSVSQRQCLVSVSKILAETPALMNTASSKSTKIFVMKSGVIMQLNFIDYKGLTQTAWGRSQRNNDKMRVVFAEMITCRKDCS